jgi:hypothetical protein
MEFITETHSQPATERLTTHLDTHTQTQTQPHVLTSAQENYYTFLQTFILHYNYRLLHRIVCETSLEVSEPMYRLLTKELESPNKHMWDIIFDRKENQDLMLYYYLFYKKKVLPSTSISAPTNDRIGINERAELSYIYPPYMFQIYTNETPFLHQHDEIIQQQHLLYPKYTYVDFVNYALEESFRRSSVTEHMHFVNRIKSGNMLPELTEKHREHSFLCDVKNNIILGIHCLIKSRMYPYNEKYNMPDLNLLSFMNYCIHNNLTAASTEHTTTASTSTYPVSPSPEEVYNDLEQKVFNEIQLFIK